MSGKDLRRISLAAKWAPSPDGFHDKHTWIASSIAELISPRDVNCPQIDKVDRAKYLIFARMAYRKHTLSPLRKYLGVVERDLTAGTFENINYERVPSCAMDLHWGEFIKKVRKHLSSYLDKVANGNANISGANIRPSKMVHSVLQAQGRLCDGEISDFKQKAQEKKVEGQWKSIVKRMKESGNIQGALAVCDVSPSMRSSGPWRGFERRIETFKDGTTSIDSAIGISLLVAEVVDGPFGGHFISFDSYPRIFEVGGPKDQRSFKEKVKHIAETPFGGSTDFVAVLEELILNTAIANQIKPEDMIQKVFVCSDMEFDHASSSPSGPNEGPQGRWSSSFERIKNLYADAGYEMPILVFWNLAGNRQGAGRSIINRLSNRANELSRLRTNFASLPA